MKIGIIYFSGTGNTKYFAEQIAKRINQIGENAVLLNVKENPSIDQFDSVVICSPIYAWRPPWTLTTWIKSLPRQDSKKTFLFITFAGKPANGLVRLARACQNRGFKVAGWGMSVAPESWTVVRTSANLERIEEKARQKQTDDPTLFGNTVIDIINGKKPPIELPQFKRSAFDLVTPFYSKLALRLWFRIHVNNSKCTQCGICTNICPTKSIKLEPFPIFSTPCAGCYGCINLCPEEALESWLTKGKLRYSPNL